MNLEELARHLDSRLPELGITRIADTSGLDRLGIHTHSCVRPGTSDTIWVYSGKGTTAAASRVSAIMECVERTSALWQPARVVVASAPELERRQPVWRPARFTEALVDEKECTPIAWVLARQLRTGGSVWVPADLVFHGHRPDLSVRAPFRCATSNGLGAGLTQRAAIGQGLLELIERDTVSCMELRASHSDAARLADLAAAMGLDLRTILGGYRDDVDLALTIDPASLPAPVAAIQRRFAAAGLEVTLKYLPNDLRIPVFGAATVETMSFDNVLATAGFGISGDLVDAACRALLELAQSRATDRQGAREDCGDGEKGRHAEVPRGHWLLEQGCAPVRFEQLPWSAGASAPLDRAGIALRALERVGLHDAAFFAFDAPVGLHAVRVLVPEVETWHATGGESRLGVRMQRARDGGG